jgi:hypothetical protein
LQILWHTLPVCLKNHNFPTPSLYRKRYIGYKRHREQIVIEKSLFDEIDYVRRERNKFIHTPSDPDLTAVISRKRVKNYGRLSKQGCSFCV